MKTYEIKDYATIKVGQLKKLIEGVDEEKEVRVWVEMTSGDSILLEGRRLIGVMDDPNDKYLCLVGGYYKVEDDEE